MDDLAVGAGRLPVDAQVLAEGRIRSADGRAYGRWGGVEWSESGRLCGGSGRDDGRGIVLIDDWLRRDKILFNSALVGRFWRRDRYQLLR